MHKLRIVPQFSFIFYCFGFFSRYWIFIWGKSSISSWSNAVWEGLYQKTQCALHNASYQEALVSIVPLLGFITHPCNLSEKKNNDEYGTVIFQFQHSFCVFINWHSSVRKSYLFRQFCLFIFLFVLLVWTYGFFYSFFIFMPKSW